MSSKLNITDGQAWKLAASLANYYTPIPSSFSSLIRGLSTDAIRNNDCIGQYHKEATLRLMNSKSILCTMYFYIKTFKSELLDGSYKARSYLVDQFRASELAAFLAILYIYRCTRKLVQDPNEWKIIADQTKQYSEIGALVGYRLGQIEPELGLLVGGIRTLTWASLLAKDEAAYKEYRRFLKKNKTIADSEYEVKTFGTTTAAISANILILLGYSKELAISFAQGMQCTDLPDRQQYPGEYNVLLTELWIDSLTKAQSAPTIQDQYSFSIDQQTLQNLLDEVRPIITSFSRYNWLDQGKTSLLKENCPELFDHSESIVQDDMSSIISELDT